MLSMKARLEMIESSERVVCHSSFPSPPDHLRTSSQEAKRRMWSEATKDVESLQNIGLVVESWQ